VKRDPAQRRKFEATAGKPGGRPGFVVDHIVSLASGGADSPSNMHWQTIAQDKDQWECKGCGRIEVPPAKRKSKLENAIGKMGRWSEGSLLI
jgi:hypothetical protein